VPQMSGSPAAAGLAPGSPTRATAPGAPPPFYLRTCRLASPARAPCPHRPPVIQFPSRREGDSSPNPGNARGGNGGQGNSATPGQPACPPPARWVVHVLRQRQRHEPRPPEPRPAPNPPPTTTPTPPPTNLAGAESSAATTRSTSRWTSEGTDREGIPCSPPPITHPCTNPPQATGRSWRIMTRLSNGWGFLTRSRL
jgi:hypothetical protein